MWTGWTHVGGRIFGRSPNQRLRMCDPRGESLGDRLFIGEAAPGPLSLKLPVQISRQPHGCFDRRIGIHTTRSPNFGIVLQKGHRRPAREPCPSRGSTPLSAAGVFVPLSEQTEIQTSCFLPDGKAGCKNFVPNSERDPARTVDAVPQRRRRDTLRWPPQKAESIKHNFYEFLQ